MSKAIEGAALIGAAIGMGALAFFDPVLIANPAYDHLMFALGIAGISMEAGAIADALIGNRGQNITTRMAAGFRQIVYGVQRIGGTIIYESTTGTGGSGGNYVYNYVIILATHEIDAIQNLYLDGRQVYFEQTANPHGYRANMGCGSVANPPATTVSISSGAIATISATGGSGFANVKPVDGYRVRIVGDGAGAKAYATNSGTVTSPVWTVHVVNAGGGYTHATAEIQGAFTFGGTGAADEQDPSQPGYGLGYGIGPGGAHYNFHNKVYAEVRFGDQVAGDIMQSLVDNDSAWSSVGAGQTGPYVGGCAYLYLNVGYDTSNFPNAPEVRLTINGKNQIFDPRSGKVGFSTNWALQVADVITDPVFGVGDVVNQAQLIAAANVCDELILTSQGNEPQYTQHIHYDTSTSPGEILAQMMPSAAGRVSYIGGEWYIWPAYFQGPSFTWDESSLIAAPSWTPCRSFKDLVNRVNGTYIAPNYPYAIGGNLYDTNGWYYGTTNNLWPFSFQATNFPQYAVDVRHGYGSDVYLAEDGGVQLPMELALRGVLSITQAQRVAKINLLRNRQQGSGQFSMQLAAWQMQPLDVMQFNFSALAWVNKLLEVVKLQFACEPMQGDGGGEVMALSVTVTVQETDPSVYEWAITEELTPYDVTAVAGALPTVPMPPTGLALVDNSTTSIMQSDGTVMPRLLVTWTPPADVYVNSGGSIQVQWQDYAGIFQTGAWIDAGTFSGISSFCYIDNVSPVTAVNVQVRSLWANGNASAWVQANNHTLPRPRPLLSGASSIPGVTVNTAVASTFTDLAELGSSNSAMTIATRGNPCLLGVNLTFASISAGGAVTGLGVTIGSTTGFAPPSLSISISGDGGGASASVSWTQTGGSGATAVWTPTLTLNGGANYTTATATITTTITSSNGDTGYSAGMSTTSCSISTPTATANVPVSVQVLMDGAVIFGPQQILTNSSGYATLNILELVLPAPSAGNHSFRVQAMTTSGTAIVSTNRVFQLVELA